MKDNNYLLRSFLLSLFASLAICCFSQMPEFLGAGNDQNISVAASSEYSNLNIWEDTAFAAKTISGVGMDVVRYEAARFLSQATLGYSSENIDEVVNLGLEGWIDDQFTKDTSYLLPRVYDIHDEVMDSIYARTQDSMNLESRPSWRFINYGFWDVNMTNDDLLRHRVAQALSEIIVISRKSNLNSFGDGMSAFYDMLLKNAFGNYEDILLGTTLNAAMGNYLTFINNYKTDTVRNIRPDENYAREVMQLFSIGLYELNPDGTRVIVDGEEVPTYTQDDIRELSRVFTGLSYGDVIPNMYYNEPEFGINGWVSDWEVPMKMYDEDDPTTGWRDEDQQEDGDKVVLGQTILDNPDGMAEVEQAVNILFDHDNVGPHIGYRLIQRLVKPNPSPAYVARVTAAFNDNGAGDRGDMKAVIKAILLDEEARDCSYQMNDHHSKLKEPLLRYLHLARAVEKTSPYGGYWNINYNLRMLPSRISWHLQVYSTSTCRQTHPMVRYLMQASWHRNSNCMTLARA